MLSGSTAAALKAARAEQSKILSSLHTHSRFQYRHYYHIQHFFVAYVVFVLDAAVINIPLMKMIGTVTSV